MRTLDDELVEIEHLFAAARNNKLWGMGMNTRAEYLEALPLLLGSVAAHAALTSDITNKR
jgi:hypothetical protein